MTYFVTCSCGKKLASPREYADHCKDFPDHFRHTPKHEPEVEAALSPAVAESEEVLRQVLRFYMQPNQYHLTSGEPISVPDFYDECSFGDFAAAALSGQPTGIKEIDEAVKS
ncbi:MAG TPA: hypothetical protein VLT57_16265 [Bryobacteraceae bacterium]|nr:hypothetical protein [Bryobacteraceae bacterium]